ncbi:MAG: TlpA family protein disulfide reductase [Deltaproteobacteria bacterium]|nr:TlpA family protein disulfide reductase [Deltaproteobacteria bacterium]
MTGTGEEHTGKWVGHTRGVVLAALAVTLLWAAWPSGVTGSTHLFKALGVEPIKPGTPAPAFTLRTPEGQKLSLADYRGKVVFLNFWATWCVPCRLEMPTMEKLHQTYQGRGLVVLAVDIQENPKKVKAFISELKLTFPAVIDATGDVVEAYKIFAVPTTILISRQGEMLGRVTGYRDWSTKEARELLDQLLNAKAPRKGR